jgi:hypothetical protein
MDLLLTDEDRERLLRWTLKQKASIVPDNHYREPGYVAVSSPEQIVELVPHRQYFVIRADWQLEDLLMRPVVNEHEGPGFYIAQRYGGPAIDYLLYPEHIENGQRTLGRGAVHHYPHYYSAKDNQKVALPRAMRDFFAQLSRFIRADAVCLKGKERAVWMSRMAADAVTSGDKHVPSEWQDAAREVLKIR